MAPIQGFHPDGKRAFTSANLRGIISYGAKHRVVSAVLWNTKEGGSCYRLIFSNGVTCIGNFADPSVMLGFFLNRGFIDRIECDRQVFNKGACLGRLSIPRYLTFERDAEGQVGPWHWRAYRDDTQSPVVLFNR